MNSVTSRFLLRLIRWRDDFAIVTYILHVYSHLNNIDRYKNRFNANNNPFECQLRMARRMLLLLLLFVDGLHGGLMAY